MAKHKPLHSAKYRTTQREEIGTVTRANYGDALAGYPSRKYRHQSLGYQPVRVNDIEALLSQATNGGIN
jgi:hypothetical protein